MRIAFLAVIALAATSCRDVQPSQASTPIVGYELDGIVTSLNGIPVDSAGVWMLYSIIPISETPLDTVTVVVKDTLKLVNVEVYSVYFQPVRKLFIGHRPLGPVPRYFWDEKDDSGRYVTSGKYYIQYMYDTTVVKIVPYLAQGHLTTITDRNGEFVIGSERLPVGELFDMYNTDSTYDATYQVMPEIELLFTRGSVQSPSYDVSLEINFITRGVFTLG